MFDPEFGWWRSWISILLAVFLAVPVFAQEAKIVTIPAVVLTSVDFKLNPIIVGKDAKIRTCPEDFNVYVRVDGTKPENKNFIYVPPKQILFSDEHTQYAILCVKILQ